MSNDNDWLKTIKEGDAFFYEYGGFASRTLRPMTVERVAKTQIIINGTKYRVDDGREIGSRGWVKTFSEVEEFYDNMAPEFVADVKSATVILCGESE